MEKEETKNKANKTRLALALATYLHTVHREIIMLMYEDVLPVD